jgi:hypothetical protein
VIPPGPGLRSAWLAVLVGGLASSLFVHAFLT